MTAKHKQLICMRTQALKKEADKDPVKVRMAR